MAEKELGGAAVRVGRAGDEIAAGARAGRVRHGVAQLGKLGAQDGLRAGLRLRRVRRRLGQDEGREQFDHGVAVQGETGEEGLGVGHGSGKNNQYVAMRQRFLLDMILEV